MHLWSYVYFTCGGSLFLALCPALIFLYFIERDVSKPLERMASSAKAFTKDDDIHLIIEKNHNEMPEIPLLFYRNRRHGPFSKNHGSELEDYVNNLAKITAEKENNATQLKIATNIQLGALPKPIEIKNVDLYATMKPTLEVGGDVYDFFMIDDNHLALVVADVSGRCNDADKSGIVRQQPGRNVRYIPLRCPGSYDKFTYFCKCRSRKTSYCP